MAAEVELAVVAALLRRGRTLDRLSTALTLLTVAAGLAPLFGVPPGKAALLVLAVPLCGLVEKYWAMRVALDAELFAELAAIPERLPERTQSLDQALGDLGLQPTGATPRPWTQRGRGALRLLRHQALWLLLQILLLTAILIWLHIPA